MIYTVVASEGRILVEYPYSDTYSAIVSKLLSTLPPSASASTESKIRSSYSLGEDQIHSIQQDGLVFLTVTQAASAASSSGGSSNSRRVPFAFLGELQTKFSKAYPSPLSSIDDYSSFTSTIAKLADQYNLSPPPDALHSAAAELSSVKDIMVQNIDRIVARGERIGLLVDKTDGLSASARAFRTRSQDLRRKMYWRNVKMMVAIGFVVLVLLYFLLASFCGFGLSHC